MSDKHKGNNIIDQRKVKAAHTYSEVEKASEENKRRYSVLHGLYVKDRGQNL